MGIDWAQLPEPRRLTAAEQAVLDRLVAHVDCAELTAQAASVWVTAVCDCGCSSVRLETDAAPLPPATIRRLSSIGRDDYFAIDFTRVTGADPSTQELQMLQVVVHVAGGSLLELEIFTEEGVPVEIPSPDDFDDITVR